MLSDSYGKETLMNLFFYHINKIFDSVKTRWFYEVKQDPGEKPGIKNISLIYNVK